MSNGSDTFYDRLSRLLRIVIRNQGIELSAFYAKGRGVVKETLKWDLPALTFKMYDDGMILLKDVYKGEEFIKRVLYTTDYDPKGGG